MECKEDYSIFLENVRRELRTAMMDYHFRRSNEDEQQEEQDMTNSEYPSEGGSDGETNEDKDDVAFEPLEVDWCFGRKHGEHIFHHCSTLPELWRSQLQSILQS